MSNLTTAKHFDQTGRTLRPSQSAGLLNRERWQDHPLAVCVNQSPVRGEHLDDVEAPCEQSHSAGGGYKGSAVLTKALAAFRKIGMAVIESETLLVGGVGFHREGWRGRALALFHFAKEASK